MDYWSSALVSFLLLITAVGLLVWHVRAWRAARAQPIEPKEFEYRRHQFRRRMQTSAMLGLLGVLIPLGQWLTPWAQSRLFAAIFWGGVLLLIVWMALLALVDILATHYHFSRLRNDYLIERAKLNAEIRRMQAVRANGKVKDPQRGTKP